MTNRTPQTPAESAMTPVPAPRRSRLRAWSVRVVIALVLLFVLLEGGLRLVLGLGNPVLYRADPSCGYLPAPNQHVRRFFCHNNINSFSQRSPQLPPAKPPGTLRALFIGDSVTYGTTFVDQSRIFTSLLGPELRAKLGREVQVLNASAGAWAIGNELGYLQSRGTFGADVVVFVLNSGDFTQPFNHQALSLESGYPDHKPALALQELWRRYLRPRVLGGPVAMDAGATVSALASEEEAEANLRRLQDARDLVIAAHGRFAVVYSPSVGSDLPSVRGDLARYQRWAKDAGVEFLDLTKAYAAAPANEVYQDGVHLKPRGNELAASAITTDWPAIWASVGGPR